MEFEILKIKNRINLLSERSPSESAKIIKKLERRLRRLKAATQSEDQVYMRYGVTVSIGGSNPLDLGSTPKHLCQIKKS